MTLKKAPFSDEGCSFSFWLIYHILVFCEFGDSREGGGFDKSLNLQKLLFQSFMHEVREWLESLFSAACRAAIHSARLRFQPVLYWLLPKMESILLVTCDSNTDFTWSEVTHLYHFLNGTLHNQEKISIFHKWKNYNR